LLFQDNVPFNVVGRCRFVRCKEFVDGVRTKFDAEFNNADGGGKGKTGVDVSPIKSCKLAELKSLGP